jgi:acyl-CoA synthetase (AMP-forming)/AMP-acid ligase II
VPLSQRASQVETCFQLHDSGAVAIAFDGHVVDTIQPCLPQLPQLSLLIGPGGNVASALDDVVSASRPQSSLPAPQPNDAFCVMYTGGTTGEPKAVLQTQQSWAATVETVVEQWNVHPEDRHLVALPMTHVSWFTTAAHLHAGALAILLDRWRADHVLELIERKRISTLNLIPTMLGDLLEALAVGQTRDYSSLRLLTVAGSPTPEETLHRAHAVFGPVVGNIYGMTETSGPVTFLLPHEMTGTRVRSVGRPGAHVDIAILDETGTAVAQGSGEIALAGPQVSTGYLNGPRESSSAHTVGWFLTGDIGYLDEDGYLFIVGRRKDMIITGGYNVYSKEVEDALHSHPDVIEAAVIGVPDRKWVEAVHAFVTLRAGSLTTSDALREHCRGRLAAYKVPKVIHFELELPRTAIGKFDKRALLSRYERSLAIAADASGISGD